MQCKMNYKWDVQLHRSRQRFIAESPPAVDNVAKNKIL